MIYPYKCPSCDNCFDVIKHHSEYDRVENCTNCGIQAKRVFIAPNAKKMFRAEYNPGLGCVVKNENHKRDILKRRDLVEVGNESVQSVHSHQNKRLQEKLEKNWSDV